jgi:hypothetical protein
VAGGDWFHDLLAAAIPATTASMGGKWKKKFEKRRDPRQDAASSALATSARSPNALALGYSNCL